jgi:hypothetical protein
MHSMLTHMGRPRQQRVALVMPVTDAEDHEWDTHSGRDTDVQHNQT